MSLNLVDPSYELIDPCPDIFALFIQFNDNFFEGQLGGCEVKWSPRMTTCAGVCSYEGRGGLCSIRLSKPLLTLRPRKDLVETLLHEMIHAYLFVTVRNRDRDGHGPEFQFHMNRINSVAGTKITIYHTFHREVAQYKQHWWRCDGVCRDRQPFLGYVKRASNRAPGPNDRWWNQHRASCNGTFNKIKEPEGYGQKKSKMAGSPSKTNSVIKKTNKTLDSWIVSSSKTGQSTSNDEVQAIFPGGGNLLGHGEVNNNPRAIRANAQTTGGSTNYSAWLDRLENKSEKPLMGANISRSNDSWLDRLEKSRQETRSSNSAGNITVKKPESNGTKADSCSKPSEELQSSAPVVTCPSCGITVDKAFINGHLDYCAD